jgi:predicted dehydrogenase/threonine dehydrogenase-like Zn-dependent dehydrogenase
LLQVFQDPQEGSFEVREVPSPACLAGGLLVQLDVSLISSGTERSKAAMGSSSMLAKARARPDLVRQVLERSRAEGVGDTIRLVRERLSAPQPLGYSAAGTVVEVGSGAAGFEVGQQVAIAGAGFANHAEICSIPLHLATPVPDTLDMADACFATVAAIALQGIRQAKVSPGEIVAVIGLGLVGQLAARLLHAYGYPVVGLDISPIALARAAELPLLGAWRSDDKALETRVAEVTQGRGVDAVIVTAATKSSEPLNLASRLLRDRGRMIVVGDVGMHLSRQVLYTKELDVRMSRSYGPGRYDPAYELRGHDYPIGHVRWTEQRNLAEIIRLLAARQMQVDDLVTHTFPITKAADAYRTLSDPEVASLAILLTYPPHSAPLRRTFAIEASASAKVAGPHAVSLIGAGNFASRVLVPAIVADGRLRLDTVVTQSGATAAHLGRKANFLRCSSDPTTALDPTRTRAVVIATRHDTHASLVARALEAGLAVFVEKPLAIDEAGLLQIMTAYRKHAGVLQVGFNRRFSGPVVTLLEALPARSGPGLVTVRVAAGALPNEHWALDARQGGGRIVGEVCHFVDLAAAVLGQAPAGAYARASDRSTPWKTGSVSILLDFPDRSTAVIQYHAVGGRRMPKELVEAAWDGYSAQIDDFRSLRVWGEQKQRRQRWRPQDKGHRRELTAFVDWVVGGVPAWDPVSGFTSTAATLAILRSLETGERVSVSDLLCALRSHAAS